MRLRMLIHKLKSALLALASLTAIAGCATQALVGQVPEIGIRRSEPPPVPPAISTQEQIDAARLLTVPTEVRAIRARQLEFARELGVDVTFNDRGRVSQTSMRGVPAYIWDTAITSEDQVIALADALYPLFGFSDTERLIYSGKVGNTYTFREQINGLPVESMTTNIAIGPDQTIFAIRGTAVMDRNFERGHFLDEQGAIDAVNRHVGAEGLASVSSQNSEHIAYLVYKYWDDYRTLAPWWFVGGDYYVDPDGFVSSAVMVTP